MVGNNFTTEVSHRSWKDIVKDAEQGSKSVLTFEFLEDIAPIPIEEIVDTYLWVMAPTSIEPVVRDAMLPLWLHGYLMQKPNLSLAAFAPLTFPKVSFYWPLFETFKAQFVAQDVWPENWRELQAEQKNRTFQPERHKIELLGRFISSKIANRRDAAGDTPDSPFAKWGWRMSTVGENNARLVEGREKDVTLGNWQTYPPFFPGDTSFMLMNRPKRQGNL